MESMRHRGSGAFTGGLRQVLPVFVLLSAATLALVAGCSEGEPKCVCSDTEIDFGTVFSVEDTLTRQFSIRNAGDGDRLTWVVPEFRDLGLDVVEDGLAYSLDAGESVTYTLRFAPQDSVPPQELEMRVGLDACVIRVRLGAFETRTIGACCLGDGDCLDNVFVTDCTENLGGVFKGERSSCATENCLGSCCFDDGTCEDDAFRPDCESRGGRYRGDGSTCTEDACVGACCLVDGTCLADSTGVTARPISAAGCAEADGTYRGDGTECAGVNCPQPAPGCAVSTDAVSFLFAKSDTFTVRNTGLGILRGKRPATVSCSGTPQFRVLTSAGDTDFFAIAPGDSALIEVTVSLQSFDCSFEIETNAPAGARCTPIRISSTLQLERSARF